MRVVVEIEREYEMDSERIIAEFGPPDRVWAASNYWEVDALRIELEAEYAYVEVTP